MSLSLFLALVASLSMASCPAEPAVRDKFPPVPKVKQRKPAVFHTATLKQSIDLLRVSEARDNFQVSGKGLTVAVLDTGLNLAHSDFAPVAGKARVLAKRNFTIEDASDPDAVDDANGHGSNVAGIVAANGKHKGVAWGAAVVPLKIFDNNGDSDIPQVIDGLKWVLDNREAFQISVAVLSFADGENYPSDDMVDGRFADVRDLVRKLREARLPLVVAAGNFYFKFNGLAAGAPPDPSAQASQGMCVPAVFRECISVGAVYDDDYHKKFFYDDSSIARKSGPDLFCPFSQRLHESVGKECVTDVFAPGSPTESTGIGGPDSESTDSGTSQAAPFVAGVILLLQEYHVRTFNARPCVDHIESWLRKSGVEVEDGKNEDDNVKHTHQKFRRVDAVGAFEALKNDPCKH